MFLISRPSAPTIERVLRESRDLPLSYGRVGILEPPLPGSRIDEAVAVIGHGDADFARACAALHAWRHFDIGWCELFPRGASIEAGTNVAVLIRHLGFWSLNGCRVVYSLTPVQGRRRFGFAYGTLPTHAEAGEEIFEVSLDLATGDVRYRICATSWAYAPLARIGQPIARVLQARFRRDSCAAMQRAVSARPAPASPGTRQGTGA